ncbi:MAG: PD-(D/E)XK nuclease family protein [Magnetococcales bacterium]|nr:PD-(D/E)XK nuclease family protein [Magnetococcales bacterium]MBF0150311.1 PD-(D/E)XK nuclease family protein [Magnetococcales bacterium]
MNLSASIQGIAALCSCLDRGHVLLTVNRRLSRHLTRRLNTFKASQGNTSWSSAEIIPLQAWLRKKWMECLDLGERLGEPPPRVLSDLAEHHLWERIIAEDSWQRKKILWPRQTATLAREGWALLSEWRLPPPSLQSRGHEDAEAFIRWSNVWTQQIQRKGVISSSQLMAFVERHLDRLQLPAGIVLAGFETPTPAMDHFFSLLHARGIELIPYVPETCATVPSLNVLPDHEAEIRAAARWAKQWVDAGMTSSLSAHGVGIIHPDLGRWRRQIIRIFTDVFHPGAMEWNALPENPAFNVSMGFPLLEHPMIADALFFLRLALEGQCTLEQAGRLLHSPYCTAGRSEHSSRALLDLRWRESGWRRVSLTRLQMMIGEDGGTPDLARMLERLVGLPPLLDHGSSSIPPSAWPRRFSEILATFGWPGEGRLSSSEFQIIETWKEVLAGLVSLEVVTARLNDSQALAALTHAVGELLFQPKGGEDAPVQILGSLEAGGETFAALWIMGLSDDVWPPRPQPNPFLPRAFQRSHGMPRASSEREYAFASKLTQSLLRSAPVVVVSAPRREDDMELRVSPLLQQFLPDPVVVSEDSGVESQTFAAPVLLEIVDEALPPLGGNPPFPCSTGVLKSQSLCPFQAFARYRLQAVSIPEVQTGLSPSLRGQLTHQVLSRVLRPGFSMRNWRALSDDDRTRLIEQACTGVMDLWKSKLAGRQVPQGLLVLERQRQVGLLQQWMRVEERRLTDFTVLSAESEGVLILRDLELHFRMDRVDDLEHGARILIDYKTGQVRYGDWFGTRPKDPQMPVYALALEGNLVAMAYGQISRNFKRFMGIAEREDLLPGVSWLKVKDEVGDATDFSTLKHHWRQVMDRLADDFARGEARVTPLDHACDQCDLHPLCRINESPEND